MCDVLQKSWPYFKTAVSCWMNVIVGLISYGTSLWFLLSCSCRGSEESCLVIVDLVVRELIAPRINRSVEQP